MLQKRQTTDNLVYLPVSSCSNLSTSMSQKPTGDKASADSSPANDQAKQWQACMVAVGKSQDKNAFQALYLHFAPKVTSFFFQQGLADKADELTHDVFIKIWQKAKTYDPKKAQVSTWIFTIVRNLRIDFLRKKKLDEVSGEEDTLEDKNTDLENIIELKRSKARLLSIFKSLNQEQRNVLQKVYFEDKSHQIAADELNMTPGVVKSRIRSALKVLRSQLGGDKL